MAIIQLIKKSTIRIYLFLPSHQQNNLLIGFINQTATLLKAMHIICSYSLYVRVNYILNVINWV